jgi:hypothetical protein
MKKIIFLTIISCILTSCNDFMDFYNAVSMYYQAKNFKIDEEPDIRTGFIAVSIYGTPILDEKTKKESFADDKLIVLDFHTFLGKPPSKRYRNKIRKLLVTSYGEPECVSFKGQRVPVWHFAVLEPDKPIERWELEDRYLYLNDYREWYRNVFQIRIKMK